MRTESNNPGQILHVGLEFANLTDMSLPEGSVMPMLHDVQFEAPVFKRARPGRAGDAGQRIL